MQTVGFIDREKFRPIAEDIITDEVILTDERVQHIVDRRGTAFLDKYGRYFPLVLSEPDYIFPDERKNTAIVCKVVGEGKGAVNLILRLAVEGEDPTYKNSILTAIQEGQRRFSQRLRNNVPVYRRS